MNMLDGVISSSTMDNKLDPVMRDRCQHLCKLLSNALAGEHGKVVLLPEPDSNGMFYGAYLSPAGKHYRLAIRPSREWSITGTEGQSDPSSFIIYLNGWEVMRTSVIDAQLDLEWPLRRPETALRLVFHTFKVVGRGLAIGITSVIMGLIGATAIGWLIPSMMNAGWLFGLALGLIGAPSMWRQMDRDENDASRFIGFVFILCVLLFALQ